MTSILLRNVIFHFLYIWSKKYQVKERKTRTSRCIFWLIDLWDYINKNRKINATVIIVEYLLLNKSNQKFVTPVQLITNYIKIKLNRKSKKRKDIRFMHFIYKEHSENISQAHYNKEWTCNFYCFIMKQCLPLTSSYCLLLHHIDLKWVIQLLHLLVLKFRELLLLHNEAMYVIDRPLLFIVASHRFKMSTAIATPSSYAVQGMVILLLNLLKFTTNSVLFMDRWNLSSSLYRFWVKVRRLCRKLGDSWTNFIMKDEVTSQW